uniref:C-X-C motif chemokine n=1 Tax=Piliocolobus tephrosceles TaxID=591936 RepID=A0A8C9H8N4_9PRIM
ISAPSLSSGTRDCSQSSLDHYEPPARLRGPCPGSFGLLVRATRAAAAAVDATRLRCSCLQTTQRVQPEMISNLQVFAIGPQCSEVEVVASLKNGTEVCLDPQAPFLKKVIQKILGRYCHFDLCGF